MPADNKRFCEMAAEVTVRAAVIGFTFCDSPNCVQLSRHFAKPPGRYMQSVHNTSKSADLKEDKKRFKIISPFAVI